MKTLLVPALLTGLILSPTGAFAQPAPPSGPPAPQPPAMGDRQGGEMHDRSRPGMRDFEADRTAMRSSILNALSPDHKRFVATLAGEIATAPTPDLPSAVSRLDGQLSPQEKTAVIAAAQAMRDKMRARFEGAGRGGDDRRDGAGFAPPAPDAGRIVLGTLLGGGRMEGPGGPPRGGRPMDGGPGGPPPDGGPGAPPKR